MKFEIGFNDLSINNDDFLINVLGGKLEDTGATKYPPFEKIMLELNNFEELRDVLNKVDKEFNCLSSAEISFDSPSIFINIK